MDVAGRPVRDAIPQRQSPIGPEGPRCNQTKVIWHGRRHCHKDTKEKSEKRKAMRKTNKSNESLLLSNFRLSSRLLCRLRSLAAPIFPWCTRNYPESETMQTVGGAHWSLSGFQIERCGLGWPNGLRGIFVRDCVRWSDNTNAILCNFC